MWKETFDVYVEDKHKLGMKEFFEKNSPFAYQDMTGRMVETVRKGYWKADAATKKKLLAEYVEQRERARRERRRVHLRQPAAARSTCSNRRKAAGIPVPGTRRLPAGDGTGDGRTRLPSPRK